MAADKRVTKDDKLKATPGKIVKNTDKDKVAVSKKIVGQSIADSSKSATKEMTLNDVMGAIMEMKKVQESQNTKLSDLTGRMAGVEQGTSGDVGMDFDEYGNYNNSYNDYDEESGNVEDHNNNLAGGEPSLKKQKGQGDDIEENSGDATATNDPPSQFKMMGEKMKKAEKVGEKVHEDLASNINDLFRSGMGDEVVKAMTKDIARPENCFGLSEVRTNPLIWKLLSDRAQGMDSRLRTVQISMCKAASVLAFLLDEMNTLQSQTPTELGEKFLEKGMEAVCLLGHANANLNFRRREVMKPEIDREYGIMCSPNTKFTEWLFGDNVSGDLKEIQAVNRVQSRLRGRGRGGYGGSFRGRGQNRGRGSNYGSYPNYPNYQSRGRYQGSWTPRRGRGFQRSK
jgi:hypothetical protein